MNAPGDHRTLSLHTCNFQGQRAQRLLHTDSIAPRLHHQSVRGSFNHLISQMSQEHLTASAEEPEELQLSSRSTAPLQAWSTLSSQQEQPQPEAMVFGLELFSSRSADHIWRTISLASSWSCSNQSHDCAGSSSLAALKLQTLLLTCEVHRGPASGFQPAGLSHLLAGLQSSVPVQQSFSAALRARPV